jgi:hypothetical protein
MTYHTLDWVEDSALFQERQPSKVSSEPTVFFFNSLSSEPTVFIVFQPCLLFYNSKKYPSTCLPRYLLLLDCKLVSNTFLFSTLFNTSTAHPVENVCPINRPFRFFMLTTAGTFSTDIPASLVLTQCFKNMTLILLSFERLILCLQATGGRDAELDAAYHSWSNHCWSNH